MLNTMKVEEHLEKKEEQLIRKVFSELATNRESASKHHRHYQMSLYCKVIKGFMLEQMRVSMFRERLENVYVGMLLGNHF